MEVIYLVVCGVIAVTLCLVGYVSYKRQLNHYKLYEKKELCYDMFSRRYFMASYNDISSAINELNELVHYKGSATMNDLYDKLGLPHISLGDSYGWIYLKTDPAGFEAVWAVDILDKRPVKEIIFHNFEPISTVF